MQFLIKQFLFYIQFGVVGTVEMLNSRREKNEKTGRGCSVGRMK